LLFFDGIEKLTEPIRNITTRIITIYSTNSPFC